MRILLLSSSYNSLTQRAHIELVEAGHDVTIEVAINEAQVREGVALFQPDLVLCPMLKFIIPKDLWLETPCIIIHPGIKGDRGSYSLDWAIYEDQPYWGVTAVQAADEVDSGPVWATAEFPMRRGSKSSIYRDELSESAMKVIHLVVKRFENGLYVPEQLDYSRADVKGRFRPALKQAMRQIDWQADTVETILRKIRSADGSPGLLDDIAGQQYYLYGAHREGALIGPPGKILAKRHGAICRAAVDGAVWITHLKKKGPKHEHHFKLPATQVLGELIAEVPESSIDLLYVGQVETYKEIWYREHNQIAYLYFEFYNGAMSTEQCERLTEAFKEVCRRPGNKAIVLMGGRDFWSNGIHLNIIEAAENCAEESWKNINAIDDFVEAVMNCSSHMVISAMHGSAGAGGVMMALAADKVIAREGVVLNPHYKSMGGLYGSEYWTYLLPRRVGKKAAEDLTNSCLPVSVQGAKKIGLIDDVVFHDSLNPSSFHDQVVRIAEHLCQDELLAKLLAEKCAKLDEDGKHRGLDTYREAELEKMRVNFFGEDKSYHTARSNFVKKLPSDATPAHLAVHRGNLSSTK